MMIEQWPPPLSSISLVGTQGLWAGHRDGQVTGALVSSMSDLETKALQNTHFRTLGICSSVE